MFDHIGLSVAEFSRSLTFYAAALEPLGFHVETKADQSAGLGKKGAPLAAKR